MVRAIPPLWQPDGSVESLAEPVETVTDDDGRFTLNWIRSGIWNATVSAEGYQDSTLRIEVTQVGSHVCTATGMQRCLMPVESYTAPLKSGAELKVEQALVEVALPDDGLEQAKADLIAADAAYNNQDYRIAIAGYEELLATWPQLSVLHQDIGDAHRALAEFGAAIAAYERFPAAEPEDEAIERKIARTKLLAGDLGAAEDLAAAGGAASREDLYNLGGVAFNKGNVDDAAGWYEKAVATDPGWAPPVFKLGLVALNKGDIEEAKGFFQ